MTQSYILSKRQYALFCGLKKPRRWTACTRSTNGTRKKTASASQPTKVSNSLARSPSFSLPPPSNVHNCICLLYVSSPFPLPRMYTPKFIYYMCRAFALTRALEFGSRPPGTRVERNDARIRRGAQALRRVRGAVSNIYRRDYRARAWWREGAISGMRIGLLHRLLFLYSTSL